jgi:hypothetical protein
MSTHAIKKMVMGVGRHFQKHPNQARFIGKVVAHLLKKK